MIADADRNCFVAGNMTVKIGGESLALLFCIDLSRFWNDQKIGQRSVSAVIFSLGASALDEH